MGLDQYLYRREYVGGWAWKNGDTKERDLYNTIMEYFNLDRVESSPHVNVDVCVAYWRKANAIHGYIVQNYAGGVDECQRIPMSREALQTLRDKCDALLRVPANFVGNVAEKSGLLPTSGFFFGSTDIDEWYLEDMKNTVRQLDKVLADAPEYASFYYQASW